MRGTRPLYFLQCPNVVADHPLPHDQPTTQHKERSTSECPLFQTVRSIPSPQCIAISHDPLAKGEESGPALVFEAPQDSVKSFQALWSPSRDSSASKYPKATHGPGWSTGSSQKSSKSSKSSQRLSGMSPAASSGKETAGGQSEPRGIFEEETAAICVTELYEWCMAVTVLMVLHGIADISTHQFRSVPGLSHWGVGLLLLYSWAAAATVRLCSRARLYAAYLLAVGSLLTTCQLTWHWHSHAAGFQDCILVQRPFRAGPGPCNATAAGPGPADPAACASLYGLAFGETGFESLQCAVLFIVLFQNALQSSFLCRLGPWVTGITGVLQWAVLACWPLVAPHSHTHAMWLCRLLAPGLWTAHQLRASHVREVERRRRAVIIDDLQRAVADGRTRNSDGPEADGPPTRSLKDTMTDTFDCINTFRQQSAKGIGKSKDHFLLSKASDVLFRGIWSCRLREVRRQMVAGCYKTVPALVDLRKFAEDFVRGRNVALHCPAATVLVDPVACNFVLEHAVGDALLRGYPADPEVTLWVETSEMRHSDTDTVPEQLDHIIECDAAPAPVEQVPLTILFVVTHRAAPERRGASPGPSRAPPPEEFGLQQICATAAACGMTAELCREGAVTFFELRLDTVAMPAGAAPLPVPHPVPPGLTILGLTDSAIHKRRLECGLRREIPDASVTVYGSSAAEVGAFRDAALDRGSIVIVDDVIDVPGARHLGSGIIKWLLEAGYRGFTCLGSGSPADAVSGAHWTFRREAQISNVASQLRVEYHGFLLQRHVKGEALRCGKFGARCTPRVTFLDNVHSKLRPYKSYKSRGACDLADPPVDNQSLSSLNTDTTAPASSALMGVGSTSQTVGSSGLGTTTIGQSPSGGLEGMVPSAMPLALTGENMGRSTMSMLGRTATISKSPSLASSAAVSTCCPASEGLRDVSSNCSSGNRDTGPSRIRRRSSTSSLAWPRSSTGSRGWPRSSGTLQLVPGTPGSPHGLPQSPSDSHPVASCPTGSQRLPAAKIFMTSYPSSRASLE